MPSSGRCPQAHVSECFSVRRITQEAITSGNWLEPASRPGGRLRSFDLVYTLYILKAPEPPLGLLLAAVILILSAWGPVWLGFGSTLAAAATLVNVTVGALTYNVWIAARNERD